MVVVCLQRVRQEQLVLQVGRWYLSTNPVGERWLCLTLWSDCLQ